jgi:hypothetical protein
MEETKVVSVPQELLEALLSPDTVVRLCGLDKCTHQDCDVGLAPIAKSWDRVTLKRKLDVLEKDSCVQNKKHAIKQYVYVVRHESVCEGKEEVQYLDKVFDKEEDAYQAAVEHMEQILFGEDKRITEQDLSKAGLERPTNTSHHRTMLDWLNNVVDATENPGNYNGCWDEECHVEKKVLI